MNNYIVLEELGDLLFFWNDLVSSLTVLFLLVVWAALQSK